MFAVQTEDTFQQKVLPLMVDAILLDIGQGLQASR